MGRLVCLALALALVPAWPAHADLRITEDAIVKIGDQTARGVRTTYLQGTRMRIELVIGNQSAVTLYDLDGGTIANLDAKKRRAEIYALAARSAKLEKEYPRARTTVSLTHTDVGPIAAAPCEMYAFTVRVPISSDGKTALTVTGYACVAAAAAGTDDYRTFAQASRERDFVIGWASDNLVQLAATRGQTELYRALSAMPGVPQLVDMRLDVDGKGILAGMSRKLLSASRTFTVTNLAAGPLDAALFAVPDGWTREKK